MTGRKSGLSFWHVRAVSQALFFLIAILGIFQVAMSGLIYPFFFCPASPAACAGCPIWVIEHGTLEVVGGETNGLLMLLYLAGMFLAIGVVVGRAFCGWACPMGTLQDLFSLLSKKLNGTISRLVLLSISLAAVLLGTILPYVLSQNKVEVKFYMWSVYIGALGAFLTAFSGVLLVRGKGGLIASIASLLSGALLWSFPTIASLLSLDETPFNSWELMGTFGLMALMIGTVGLISRIGALRSLRINPGSRMDRRLRWTKFALLFLVPPTTWFFDTLFFTDLDPVGGITATVPELMLSPSSWSANQFFWFKMFFTASVMVSISLVDRFWCRYLCPIGAMYGPTNKFSVSDIEFKGGSCIHCQKCIGACPMGINPKEDKIDVECIRCGRCIDACPVKAQRAVAVNPRLRRLLN